MRRLRLGALALVALVTGCDGGESSGALRLTVASGADQRGLPHEALLSVVRLRLADGDGPAAGVQVVPEVVAGGGVTQASGTRTDGAGEVAFVWRLGGVGPQRLRVTAAGADPVEVEARAVGPDEADAVVITGGSPRAIAVVSYGGASPEVVYDRRLGADETTALLPPFDAGEAEVVVFGVDRAPGVQDVSWTAGADRAEVTLRPAVPVDVILVIREPPFDQRSARARQDLAYTADLWAREGAGIVVGAVEVVDRTATGGGVSTTSGAVCGSGVLDAARITVHYIADINGTTHSGYNCNPREVYMDLSGDRYPALLAHEFGHAFGLGHTPAGLMSQRAGTQLYDGQIYLAHHSTRSALNEVFGANPEAARPCTPATCLPATYEVP